METLSSTKTIGQADTAIEPQPLPWGRSYLMCPPDYFGILYEINPWMHREVQTNRDLADEQWHNLVANLEKAGATVKIMEPVESLPDLVFAANAGLVNGRRFVVSRFRHAERQPESKYDAGWFSARGYEVTELTAGPESSFEGCGDVLPFGDGLIAGYGFRSDLSMHATLAQMLEVKVHPVKLIDPRFYHLDISFCPLDSRRALVNPAAWDRQSCQIIEQLVPEPLVLELDEALTFCANSVVVGNVVIMPDCPARVGRILEGWGFDICIAPVSEFLKAGGAVRCLTLALDMYLQGA